MYKSAEDPTLIQIVGESSAPWWGVPVIAGCFLLLGAVLGFIFNRLNDRHRERREARTRWHDLVRELSAEIVTGADRVWKLRQDISEAKINTLIEVQEQSSKKAELHNVTKHLRDKTNELILLAPKELSLAVGLFVHANIHDQIPVNSSTFQAHIKLREAFTGEVRRYLEIDPL